MNTIAEHVELPEVSVQPLVHPLELPGAGRAFTMSWWLGQLASPTIFFALAAIFWPSTTITSPQSSQRQR